MIETEKGFYTLAFDFLYYADKAKMDNWAVVCNKPNCSHDTKDCNAFCEHAFSIWIHESKLYYVNFYAIWRMDLDGKNHEKVRDLPEVEYNNWGGLLFYQEGSIFWAYQTDEEDEEAQIISRTYRIYHVDPSHKSRDVMLYEQVEKNNFNRSIYIYRGMSNKSGDICVAIEDMQGIDTEQQYFVYNLKNSSIKEIDSKPDVNGIGSVNGTDYYYSEEDGIYYYEQEEKMTYIETAFRSGNSSAYAVENYFVQTAGRGNGEIIIYNKDGGAILSHAFPISGAFSRPVVYAASSSGLFIKLGLDEEEIYYYWPYEEINKGEANYVECFRYRVGT